MTAVRGAVLVREVAVWRRVRPMAFALLLAFCAAVAAPAQAQVPPEVTLARVDDLDWQKDHAVLTVALDVFNPNSVSLPLQALHFHCVLASIPLAEGSSISPVVIGANAHAIVMVKLAVDSNAIVTLASSLSSTQNIPYAIRGTAEVGLTGIPLKFTHRGTVSFSR